MRTEGDVMLFTCHKINTTKAETALKFSLLFMAELDHFFSGSELFMDPAMTSEEFWEFTDKTWLSCL